MSERDWTETQVTGKPRFLLGERNSSKRIGVHRIEVHEDLFEDLRSIAQGALDELQRREPKPYTTFGGMTSDDYFDLDTSEIPERRDKRKREDDPEAYEIASALAMVTRCDEHPVMTAENLRKAHPSLYAIVFEASGDYVGFIRKRSPRQVVRPGWRYLEHGNTLKKIRPPDLAIDGVVDLVVASDRCAILSQTAFTTLFGDVGVAFEQVPKCVKAVSVALKDTTPLAEESVKSLRDRCGRRINDAKRLHHIVLERQEELEKLGADEIKVLLEKRRLEHTLVNGELKLNQDNVSEFLDLIEGRLFDDDVTGEERRADAYSPRKEEP